MSLLTINKNCNYCGKCIDICPALILSKSKDNKIPYTDNEDRCILCGHCVAICPKDAIKLNQIKINNFIDYKYNFNENTVKEFLLSKRSIRHFLDKPLGKDLINKIINFSNSAASSDNKLERDYIAICDKKLIKKIEDEVVKYYKNLLLILNPIVRKIGYIFAPSLFKEFEKIIPDLKFFLKKYEIGKNPVFRNAPCVICIHAPKKSTAAKDNCLSAQSYLMLYAHSLGLGSCIIGYASFAPHILEKILNISKKNRIYSIIILGFPKYTFKKLIIRKEPKIKWFI